MEVLSGAVVVAAALLLLLSGRAHLTDWRRLLSELLAHGVLSYRSSRFVARALPSVEIALVGAVALGATVFVSGDSSVLLRGASACMCGLFLVMATYLAIAISIGRGTSCACFGGDEPLSWLTQARVLVLATGTGIYCVVDPRFSRPELLLVGIAAGAVAVVLRTLPRLGGRAAAKATRRS